MTMTQQDLLDTITRLQKENEALRARIECLPQQPRLIRQFIMDTLRQGRGPTCGELKHLVTERFGEMKYCRFTQLLYRLRDWGFVVNEYKRYYVTAEHEDYEAVDNERSRVPVNKTPTTKKHTTLGIIGPKVTHNTINDKSHEKPF